MSNTGVDDRWPSASLDRVARTHALAAAMPGTWVEQRVIAGPFDEVWSYLADLERSVPEFESDVSALRITRRDGTRLRLRAKASWKLGWMPVWFDVDLDRGWCLMTSRPQAYVIVMAAEPAGDGLTKLAHLEGIAIGAPTWVARLLRPALAISRWRHRHHVPRDVAGMERGLRSR